jgi:hypothetical protein
MILAILRGRKTQTRRLKGLKDQDSDWAYPHSARNDGNVLMQTGPHDVTPLTCPYGKPGDRLWVRETWRPEELETGEDGIRYKADNVFVQIENSIEASDRWIDACHKKSGEKYPMHHWRPSIFMPRWASRILMEITDIRFERLKEISLHDINAEGTPDTLDKSLRPFGSRREHFQRLWDSIHGKSNFSWDKDPWVWVIEFKVLEPAPQS